MKGNIKFLKHQGEDFKYVLKFQISNYINNGSWLMFFWFILFGKYCKDKSNSFSVKLIIFIFLIHYFIVSMVLNILIFRYPLSEIEINNLYYSFKIVRPFLPKAFCSDITYQRGKSFLLLTMIVKTRKEAKPS